MRRVIFFFILLSAIGSQAQSPKATGFDGGGAGQNPPPIIPPGPDPKPKGGPKPKIPPIPLQYNNDTSYFTSLKANALAHYEPEFVNQDTNLTAVEGQFIPRPYLRKADEKFRKRVWRVIDLRQKLNKSWTWKRGPIAQVFWELATQAKVRAYANDSLHRIITPEDIVTNCGSLQKSSVLRDGLNPDSVDLDEISNYKDTFKYENFKWQDIYRFEIMEDWIFDYKHGEMRPVIIAIAPLINIEENKSPKADFRPYWLKMDDCRPTLAKSQVFNRYNDAMRLNWDQHINGHRLFDSYIVKTTDQDDLYLNGQSAYREDGTALLLESEKIKNDLFIFEHDLWEY